MDFSHDLLELNVILSSEMGDSEMRMYLISVHVHAGTIKTLRDVMITCRSSSCLEAKLWVTAGLCNRLPAESTRQWWNGFQNIYIPYLDPWTCVRFGNHATQIYGVTCCGLLTRSRFLAATHTRSCSDCCIYCHTDHTISWSCGPAHARIPQCRPWFRSGTKSKPQKKNSNAYFTCFAWKCFLVFLSDWLRHRWSTSFKYCEYILVHMWDLPGNRFSSVEFDVANVPVWIVVCTSDMNGHTKNQLVSLYSIDTRSIGSDIVCGFPIPNTT